MHSIFNKYNIIKCDKLEKGWSKDEKFILVDITNNKYILRVSDTSLYEKRFNQYNLLKSLLHYNINCPKPLDFGYLNDNKIYMLISYMEGEVAEEKIIKYSNIDQYRLGVEAGIIMKKLHNYNGKTDESWWNKYKEKAIRKIDVYNNSMLKHKNSEFLIEYYKKNIYLMENRPQVLTHGDFHLGNMLIHENHIVVLDFDKMNYADPFDEFKPYYWNVCISKYFETGLINGYFENKIPEDFFKILKFYTIEVLISHLPWAMTFGEKEVKIAFEMYDNVNEWYEDFNLEVPNWYMGVLE